MPIVVLRKVKSEEALLDLFTGPKYGNKTRHEVRRYGAVPIASGDFCNFNSGMFKYAGQTIAMQHTMDGSLFSSNPTFWWREDWLEPLEPPTVKLKLHDGE